MSVLLDLAERCEKAEGPSYALECAIWDSVYPGERQARFDKLTAPGQVYHRRLGSADLDGYVKPLQAFTVSIDGALTLVPPDLFPTIDFVNCRCWVRTAAGFDLVGGVAFGFAKTVPLAVCAAALRARAALEVSG